MIKFKFKAAKALAAFFLAGIMFAAAPVFALAQTLEFSDYTVNFPEDMYVFDRYTSASDPSWTLAGVASPQETQKMYQEMNAEANFISKDGKINILLTKKQSDYSKSIFNFRDITEEQRQSVLEYLGQPSENAEIDISYYEQGAFPFFRIMIEYSQEDGKKLYELIYGTIINGYTLAFDTYSGDGPVSGEAESVISGMVDSIEFTNIVPIEDSRLSEDELTRMLIIGAVILLAVIASIIYFPIKRRMEKKEKEKLAQKLSEYRKEHGENQNLEGDIKFVNSTECTNELIHRFSFYHAYVKGIASIIFGVAMGLILLVITFLFDAEWWMKLLAGAVIVYYIYKIMVLPSNIEKAQRKVFSMGTSKTAHYIFYEDGFRVSGIQYASVYSYLNILSVRKTKDCYYLYYGPDNAYILLRKGFTTGTEEEFMSFINSRLEENKK